MKRILALFTALLLLTGCSSLAQPLPADTPLPPETDSSADPDSASAPEDDADVSDPAPDAESAALWQSYLEHVDGDSPLGAVADLRQ